MKKAFIISLSKIESSFNTANAMVEPLQQYGFDVELFEGTYGNEAVDIFKKQERSLHCLDHYANENKKNRKTSGPGAKGCFYSHYRLWQKCVDLNETIWIFEDDVEFIRPYNSVEFDEVLITVVGSWKKIFETDPYYPLAEVPTALDFTGPCLPGTPGYAITPRAAKKLVKEFSNSYTAADSAIRASVVDIKLHSHLMGRPLVEEDGKTSLTNTKIWDNC